MTTGGVVFRTTGEDLWFLPASVASEVVPVPEVARVPGAPGELFGVAVHAGEAIPVVAVGGGRGCMLVCSYLGEKVGLVGLLIEATGRFPTAADESVHGESVLHEGRTARLFDVSMLVAKVCGERFATPPALR